ncbi:PREDICTED: uncharacterized protein LOC109300531 [Gavialis gangeticus]|uniref:uncharacterized protein LOC109300531 n=1 Tax=Gavialis gangeticus TaxID=94835 RepID=UPI00092EC4CB|nr:PREDICTED: uncharacterized protein LOC109300531 [Gavialis gangeticus]
MDAMYLLNVPGVKKKILHGGCGQLPTFQDGSKITFHFQTLKDDFERTVIDDSRESGIPMEIIVGKMFKMEVWETLLTSMRIREVAEFWCDAVHTGMYALVSKGMRRIAEGKDPLEGQKHRCGMGNMFDYHSTGYEDLDELQRTPQPLIFIMELFKVDDPSAYKRDTWAMSKEEKLAAVPVLHSEGNRLVLHKKYHEAAEKYQEAVICLRNLQAKEKPWEEDWLKLQNLMTPLMLNYCQCQLELGEYYEVLEHTTEILQKNHENAKAYFKRAKAHAAVWNEKEARNDFLQAAQLDPSMAAAAKKEMKILGERMRKKHVEDRKRYQGLFQQPQPEGAATGEEQQAGGGDATAGSEEGGRGWEKSETGLGTECFRAERKEADQENSREELRVEAATLKENRRREGPGQVSSRAEIMEEEEEHGENRQREEPHQGNSGTAEVPGQTRQRKEPDQGNSEVPDETKDREKQEQENSVPETRIEEEGQGDSWQREETEKRNTGLGESMPGEENTKMQELEQGNSGAEKVGLGEGNLEGKKKVQGHGSFKADSGTEEAELGEKSTPKKDPDLGGSGAGETGHGEGTAETWMEGPDQRDCGQESTTREEELREESTRGEEPGQGSSGTETGLEEGSDQGNFGDSGSVEDTGDAEETKQGSCSKGRAGEGQRKCGTEREAAEPSPGKGGSGEGPVAESQGGSPEVDGEWERRAEGHCCSNTAEQSLEERTWQGGDHGRKPQEDC